MSKPPKTASRSRYVTSTMSGERVQAFVPAPLPPDARTVDLASLQGILAEANQAVGRLDGMTSAFPDLNLFLYSYVRKEAVLSSQIEGTQSSLSDLLLYENAEIPGVPLDDVQEVPARGLLECCVRVRSKSECRTALQ
jgi:Fic family protein